MIEYVELFDYQRREHMNKGNTTNDSHYVLEDSHERIVVAHVLLEEYNPNHIDL